MNQALSALSLWLHSLATVILIGHFVLLRLIYLPALPAARGEAAGFLGEVSRRSRRLLYAAMLIFFITGGYLTLINSNYLGLGNFTSPWALLMLVKHLVVGAMLVVGGWYNGMQRVGPTLAANPGGAPELSRFRRYVDLMALGGILVLLLTALSQVM